jgi:type IV secretory pathway VirJ component
MKFKKPMLISLLLGMAILSISLMWTITPPIVQKSVQVEDFGEVAVAQPMWNAQGLTLVFVDTQKFPAADLAEKLATIGIIAAVVDSTAFYNRYKMESKQCLSIQNVSDFIKALLKALPTASEDRVFVTGIAEGALVPFINAQLKPENNMTNVSMGFTVELPAELNLCPPYITETKEQKRSLVSAPDIKGNWRSVWNDQPVTETAIFIKEKVSHADTYLAAYNTPLDGLLVSELKSRIGQGKDLPPMPIIEVPASNAKASVTLFYSGDGGWRDLDRSVADEMTALNYSVLGVDVLRYFWQRKTPEQVTADLAATMRYYRTKWGVKSFVLAGFSFGADILPVIYNRLPASDKANVDLLVFLALGTHADFEVHVAGWLGQTTHEMPLAPELAQIPKNKILCIYGTKEKAKTGTACTSLENTEATVLELPGGHHFDKDYPKLTRLILDGYKQHGIY